VGEDTLQKERTAAKGPAIRGTEPLYPEICPVYSLYQSRRLDAAGSPVVPDCTLDAPIFPYTPRRSSFKPIAYPSLLIPLTPAGWGIQEAGIVIVFAAVGISATIATSFALLTRLVEVAVDFFFGSWDLFKKSKKNTDLFSFYNTIDGDIDERAYNSDLLVQRYFQRRKTEAVRTTLAVNASDIIVDIGCGSGVQLQEIGRKEYALAVGIDVSLNAVLHGRKKSIKNTDFIIADAQHLPVKSSCVDKIVCAEIIEHVKEPDNLIKEISRILKDGGEVVITTPNDRSVWGVYELFWDLFGRGRNYGETHLRFFSESGLRSYFPAYSECSTRTLFFIAPLFALTNSQRLLAIGIRFDQVFERWGIGVSLLLHARK